MPDSLTIRRPDDLHLHLRDGALMRAVLPYSARHFARVVVMPNLVPPVTTVADAIRYRRSLLDALGEGDAFEPLMALYLTETTTIEDVAAAADDEHVIGFKLYPAGATTHSDAGVGDLSKIAAVLEAMSRLGVPLLVHGEVTRPEIDVFDREARFIDEVLAPLADRLPELRIVLEHVSTRRGVEFVTGARPGVAATLTPQHLFHNRNAILVGGIRPHNYCLPVLKREEDRAALVDAATSGDARFFLGTDSAPHERAAKESDCGCAGTFNAVAALPVLAQVFEAAGALARLEAFTSEHGARFYGLPNARGTLTLERKAWRVPALVEAEGRQVVPWLAGQTLDWQVTSA